MYVRVYVCEGYVRVYVCEGVCMCGGVSGWLTVQMIMHVF